MEEKFVIKNKGPYGEFFISEEGLVSCVCSDEPIYFTEEQAKAVCNALECDGNIMERPVKELYWYEIVQ